MAGRTNTVAASPNPAVRGYDRGPVNAPGGGYPYPSVVPTVPAEEVSDPVVTNALRANRQGSLLYLVAWLAIGLAVVLLALDLAFIIGSVTGGGQVGNLGMELTLSSLALLGGGLAVRGVAFSLMMRADFLLKSRLASTGYYYP